MFMRGLMKEKRMSKELVDRVRQMAA